MKTPYMFLTTVVPGPHDPTQGIDVYLQPLIEELKKLWNEGVKTNDVSTIFFLSVIRFFVMDD